jgi:hypothetical protein
MVGQSVDLKINFPDEAEKIYQDAVAFRKLTSSDRFLAILDLMSSGLTLIESSPQKEAIQRWKLAQEAEWRKIQKELFNRHGRGPSSTSTKSGCQPFENDSDS